MNARFAHALDIYAVANTYPSEGLVLARMTQRTAICYALKKASKAELLVLLVFANSLAYLGDEVYSALTRRLKLGQP